MMYGWYGSGGCGFAQMGYLGWITAVLTWTLLALGIVALIKWINKK